MKVSMMCHFASAIGGVRASKERDNRPKSTKLWFFKTVEKKKKKIKQEKLHLWAKRVVAWKIAAKHEFNLNLLTGDRDDILLSQDFGEKHASKDQHREENLQFLKMHNMYYTHTHLNALI